MELSMTSEGLIVRDFDMGSYLSDGDNGYKGFKVDPKYITTALAVDAIRRAKGKCPKVWLNHTTKLGKPNPACREVGVITRLDFKDHLWLGDLFISDPDVAVAFESGRLQSRSLELGRSVPFLAGVALLENDEGFFEEELSPVPMSYDFKDDDVLDESKIILTSLNVNIVKQDQEIQMDKAEIQAMIDAAVKAALESKTFNYDPQAERETIKEEVRKEVEFPVAKAMLDLENEMAHLKLGKNGVPFTKNQVARKLAEFATKGERDLWIDLQIERFSNKKSVELETEDLTPETFLAQEWSEKGGLESLGFSKDEYVQLHLESTKKNWDSIR